MALNHAELIDAIAEATGETKTATRNILAGLHKVVNAELNKPGGKVKIAHLCVFERVHRKARTVNVFGKTKKIPAGEVVKIRPYDGLKGRKSKPSRSRAK